MGLPTRRSPLFFFFLLRLQPVLAGADEGADDQGHAPADDGEFMHKVQYIIQKTGNVSWWRKGMMKPPKDPVLVEQERLANEAKRKEVAERRWEHSPAKAMKTFLVQNMDAARRKAVHEKELAVVAQYQKKMQAREYAKGVKKQQHEDRLERMLQDEERRHQDKLWLDAEKIKKKQQEEKLRKEKLEVQQGEKKRLEDVKIKAKQLKLTEKAKKWAKAHYRKAYAGEKCPKGFQPISDRMHCKLAQLALGGIDDLDLTKKWPNHPGGCYVHLQNNHVNFNTLEGRLNEDDSQLCESKLHNKVPGHLFDD